MLPLCRYRPRTVVCQASGGPRRSSGSSEKAVLPRRGRGGAPLLAPLGGSASPNAAANMLSSSCPRARSRAPS
eukprot:4152671-Lingulodinium_polyedra.AAC.1